jgi:hypothetical protein
MNTTKTTTTTTAGIKVKAGVKAGGLTYNHNRVAAAVRVSSGVRAGACIFLKNHSVRLLVTS